MKRITVPQTYQRHFQEAIGKVNSIQIEIDQLEAGALRKVREKEAMEQHLSLSLGLLARTLGLDLPVKLTNDCQFLEVEGGGEDGLAN
jgi:hypothetical protein